MTDELYSIVFNMLPKNRNIIEVPKVISVSQLGAAGAGGQQDGSKAKSVLAAAALGLGGGIMSRIISKIKLKSKVKIRKPKPLEAANSVTTKAAKISFKPNKYMKAKVNKKAQTRSERMREAEVKQIRKESYEEGAFEAREVANQEKEAAISDIKTEFGKEIKRKELLRDQLDLSQQEVKLLKSFHMGAPKVDKSTKDLVSSAREVDSNPPKGALRIKGTIRIPTDVVIKPGFDEKIQNVINKLKEKETMKKFEMEGVRPTVKATKARKKARATPEFEADQ